MFKRTFTSNCARFPRQAQRLAIRTTTAAPSLSTISSVRHIRPRATTNTRLNSSSSKSVDNDSSKPNSTAPDQKKAVLIRLLAGGVALAGIGTAYLYLRENGSSGRDKETRSPDDEQHKEKSLILSPPEATEKLRENQLSVLLKNKVANNIVWRYDTNQVASNSPVEDSTCEMAFINGSGKGDGGEYSSVDKLFFGVFDGHSGWNCSKYLSKYLIPFVKEHLDKALSGGAGGAADRQQLVANTLQNAFLSLDSDIVSRSIEPLLNALRSSTTSSKMIDESVLNALTGSCAILAYIDAANKDLYVACTGDSRAILGVRDNAIGDWKAVPLSEDQTGRNENEVKRLQNEHPDEENIISHGRVFGGLEPTRAFGDARYKWDKVTHDSIYDLFEEKRNIPGGDRNKTPPYVTARPEVTYHRINENDKFLVLATDGLWDRLSNDEVVKLVGGLLDGKPQNFDEQLSGVTNVKSNNTSKPIKQFAYVDENASTHLIRNALGGAVQEILCSVLSLPSPLSRKFRDDITVTVVFFGEESST